MLLPDHSAGDCGGAKESFDPLRQVWTLSRWFANRDLQKIPGPGLLVGTLRCSVGKEG